MDPQRVVNAEARMRQRETLRRWRVKTRENQKQLLSRLKALQDIPGIKDYLSSEAVALLLSGRLEFERKVHKSKASPAGFDEAGAALRKERKREADRLASHRHRIKVKVEWSSTLVELALYEQAEVEMKTAATVREAMATLAIEEEFSMEFGKLEAMY
jgi:hypothetical protein